MLAVCESISKGFTALAVGALVDDGLLSLDSPVRPVLGDDLPLIDDAVTVEHLLGHTSGIGDYLDEEAGWEVDDFVLTLPVHTLTTAEAFLPRLDGHPQAFPPGERFAYCNGGYMVLALALERATGRTYHDVVQSLVLEPAGLRHTCWQARPGSRSTSPACRRRAGVRRTPSRRRSPWTPCRWPPRSTRLRTASMRRSSTGPGWASW